MWHRDTFNFLLKPLISGCDVCRDPQSSGSFQLTENEIYLIPYTDYVDLRYENEEGAITVGSTQPKIIENFTRGKKAVNTANIKRSVVF